MNPKQLPLIKNHSQTEIYVPGDYFVSQSNEVAYKNLIDTPWRCYCAVLLGSPQSGRTHLARLWAARFDALVVECDLRPELMINNNCVIEDIERFGQKIQLETLLHFYNSAVENGNFLLMTATSLDFAKKLPDLSSRIFATPTFKLDLPDDDLLRVIIRKHFYMRQIGIEEGVVDFILYKTERSVKSIIKFIDYADAESVKLKKKISVNFLNKIYHAYNNA